MATTIMLLTVLTALVKTILFNDDDINNGFYSADMAIEAPRHYGIVRCDGRNTYSYIHISVDPNTLNVESYWETESYFQEGYSYGITITWDVEDPSSIGRNIFAVYTKIDYIPDINPLSQNEEEQIIKSRIQDAAKIMNNKIINIKVD